MLFRPTNPLSHRLARIAFILAIVAALSVASAGPLLRYAGIEVDAAINLFLYGFYLGAAGMKAQMKSADRSGAQVAIIIGTNELESGQVLIRPMNSGEQYSVNRADLLAAVQNEVSKFRSAN